VIRPESIVLVTLSGEGLAVAERIRGEMGRGIRVYAPADATGGQERRGGGGPAEGISPFSEGVVALTASLFDSSRGLVFIMPMGVVIRAIAPLLRDKREDPAVVTVDVAGRYVVSTLSGHEGGANVLAERVARALNTDFVVTTSTEAAKSLILGIGCRRGVSAGEIGEAVSRALSKLGRSIEDVRLISTAERKKDEEGLLRYCEEKGIPLRSVSVAEIRESRIRVRESPLVRRVLGVGAVAVPCALLGGRKTELLLDRTIWKRVTVAAAREHFDW
jgi:cobalt-precorrin 5A hydrolase